MAKVFFALIEKSCDACTFLHKYPTDDAYNRLSLSYDAYEKRRLDMFHGWKRTLMERTMDDSRSAIFYVALFDQRASAAYIKDASKDLSGR
jgi:hypothetical protein